MYNKCVIVGRLTADPELRQAGGHSVCSFTVAVDRGFKDKDGNKQTDFIRCNVWRQGADFLTRYGAKGRVVLVDGQLQGRKYQDKDGNNRESWEIVADQVSLLDRAKDAATADQNDAPRTSAPSAPSNQAPEPPDITDPFADQ